jgi:hypothetical protein
MPEMETCAFVPQGRNARMMSGIDHTDAERNEDRMTIPSKVAL